jgi:iron complex outermembrane receptor protein/vitamin B12 transporter
MLRFSRKIRWTCSFVCVCTALILACPAFTLGAPLSGLRGTVFDPSGAAIANAKVELLENGLPAASVTADAKGGFSLPVNSARGLLRVSAPGFGAVEKAFETAGDSPELTVDIILPIASLSQQITVTATGAPTPQAQLGSTVTVLDSSDYQGMRDIQQGLRMVPGLQVTETGQAGGTTGLYIRGGSSDANKVLIDGIPMNDIGGNVEFANVSSSAITQTEVLRGPNSALYGADALAGVVSLTTARGSTPLPLIAYQADGGNFGTYHQEGSVSGEHKQFDYFSDYSRFDSGNALPDDEYHNGTFSGNYGWQLSPTSSLRATVHDDQIASGQPGAMQIYGLPTDAKQSNEDAYFGVTWESQTTPKWNNLLRYGGVRLRSDYIEFAPAGTTQDGGYSYQGAPVTIHGANGYTVSGQAQIYNDGPPYPYSYALSTDKDFVYAQSDYHFNPHLLGLVAFRYEDERGYAVSPSPLNSVERGNYDYTFEFQGDIRKRLFYTVGSGLENNGLFGVAGTPRASLAWKVTDGTKLRASFGKGIKEPALYDQIESLYGTLESLGEGQIIAQDHIAPIGPENSRTYDGGIDQYLFSGRTRLSLSLFHNEFTNKIEYVSPQELPLIDPAITLPEALEYWPYGAEVNSEAYRAQGVEAEIESQVMRDWFVRAGYTYVDARIQQSLSGSALCPPPPYNPLIPNEPCYNPLFPSIQIGADSPLVGARPFRIAPHTGYFQAGYRHAKLFAALSGTMVSRRDDSDFLEEGDANYGNTMLLPNRNLDAAYQNLSLAASYQAGRHIAVEGNFQNLLCEHYSEAFGFPSLPFTFRMGLKFTLGGNLWFSK